MARNRIIHNVQDVFVGSTPDEVDNLVTGIADHQLLKRITRVQTFSYSINTPQDDALSLGKSVPFSRVSNQPPSVSLSLTYLLNGVDNERRAGLNVESIEDRIYTSDFSAGIDGWTGTNGTLIRVINYGGDTNVLKFTPTGSSVSHCLMPNVSLVAGKKYKITGKFYVDNPAGAVTTGIYIELPGSASMAFYNSAGGWIEFSGVFTAGIHPICFYATNAGGDTVFTPGASDNFAVKDIVVTEIKCATHDMLTASTKDARNIYLTINEQDQDAQQQKDWSSSYSHLESTVGDASATGYSVVAFQNCYLTNYSLTIQPQSLPQVSLSYSADNMNAYSSGSGIEIPTLQAKSGIVTGDGTEFIIPNQYVDNEQYTGNFTKDYSRTLVTISNVGVSGVTGFLNDEVTSCSIDFSIDRDDIGYVGHKLVSDRKPKVPMMSNLSLDTLVKENITGSFLDNMKENENYNVTIDLKSKNDQTLASYVFSGAKFEGVNYDASLNANKTASLKFSNYMDLENQSEGLFVTGLITSATSGTDVIYPQF